MYSFSLNIYDILGKTILQINFKKMALDDHLFKENKFLNLQGINPSMLVSSLIEYSCKSILKMKRLHYKNNEYQKPRYQI